MKFRGITWNHPRGYDPLVACSEIWEKKTGHSIEWEKRSLQDFENFPVEELARRYDLLVIDHPHIGVVSSAGCLLGFDRDESLASNSVGASYESYCWNDVQWALPIDAAAQVQAYRPDLAPAPLKTWSEVLSATSAGEVIVPLKAPHSLMCFFTLAANLGHPCAVVEGQLIESSAGVAVAGMLADLVAGVDPACFDMDPIDVLDTLSEKQSRNVFAPLIYGYANYAEGGFRPARIRFADIPVAGRSGPVGSALGGTGIAVSAFTKAPDAAKDFARWVAGAEAQTGPYAASGGQPGHATAWDDGTVNKRTHDFYRGTRETLEGAWLRPRHKGYMAFQQEAAELLNDGLRSRRNSRSIVENLQSLYVKCCL